MANHRRRSISKRLSCRTIPEVFNFAIVAPRRWALSGRCSFDGLLDLRMADRKGNDLASRRRLKAQPRAAAAARIERSRREWLWQHYGVTELCVGVELGRGQPVIAAAGREPLSSGRCNARSSAEQSPLSAGAELPRGFVGDAAGERTHFSIRIIDPVPADGIEAPWPGLLSGGPNAHGGGSGCDKRCPSSRRCGCGSTISAPYSMNEIAINWNAPLVFLLAGVNEGG